MIHERQWPHWTCDQRKTVLVLLYSLFARRSTSVFSCINCPYASFFCHSNNTMDKRRTKTHIFQRRFTSSQMQRSLAWLPIFSAPFYPWLDNLYEFVCFISQFDIFFLSRTRFYSHILFVIAICKSSACQTDYILIPVLKATTFNLIVSRVNNHRKSMMFTFVMQAVSLFHCWNRFPWWLPSLPADAQLSWMPSGTSDIPNKVLFFNGVANSATSLFRYQLHGMFK